MTQTGTVLWIPKIQTRVVMKFMTTMTLSEHFPIGND
jgi:hypothetical protein